LGVSISKTSEITSHLDPKLPMIEADVGQIRQIVMNLIVNASDAIGEREGKIILRTGTIDAKRADLESAYMPEVPPEGKYIFIEVSDDGIGMDAETRARIFEPFFTTKMTGRGLGLAAVLGIVRGHHGVIDCDSELGKGTTFRVLLPVPVVVPKRGESNNGRKLLLKPVKGTVLIVDDDETVRLIARRIVEKMGFEVLLAVDGRDGLDVFREHARQITVVLLDMTMPRMNGDEALEHMRQIDSSVPIILTSGYNETEISGRFAGHGPAGFIQKPYRPRELYEKLASVLQLRNESGNQPR
jgi:CheY-like chemotaxis protein